MKPLSARLLWPVVFIAGLLVVDQASKWFVLERIFRPSLGAGEPLGFLAWPGQATPRLDFVSLPVLPFFNLTMVWNEGVSFGLLAADGPMGTWLLKGLALAIVIGFSVWLARSQSVAERVSLALIIGGALGNIYDRARFGAVADFFHVYWCEWHFPVFNVADACISIGVAALLIFGLFFDKTNRQDSSHVSH